MNTIDPTSRPLLERAVASLGGGEKVREAVMVVYRLGVVDGTLAGMDGAIDKRAEWNAAMNAAAVGADARVKRDSVRSPWETLLVTGDPGSVR